MVFVSLCLSPQKDLESETVLSEDFVRKDVKDNGRRMFWVHHSFYWCFTVRLAIYSILCFLTLSLPWFCLICRNFHSRHCELCNFLCHVYLISFLSTWHFLTKLLKGPYSCIKATFLETVMQQVPLLLETASLSECLDVVLHLLLVQRPNTHTRQCMMA